MSVRSFSKDVVSQDFVVSSHGLYKVTALTREFSRMHFFQQDPVLVVVFFRASIKC